MSMDVMPQNGMINLYLKIFRRYTAAFLLLAVIAFGGIADRAFAFTPGEGGHITDMSPFVSAPNAVPGLYVTLNHRYPDFIGDGTHPELDLNFPIPSSYGATSVTLQYSLDGIDWSNFQANGTDVTTDYNNFSIQPDGNDQYRLLVNGGPKDGFTSNVVAADLSLIDTRFAGWGLDESMWISGVMMPWVGRGLTANFTVHEIDGDSAITGHLDYQWYRINPATYEMTPISGATDTTYITTLDDVGGYLLICRATGDGIGVGGYAQVGSLGYATVIPNPAEVTDLTSQGFTLSLKKSVDSLLPETLSLTYYDSRTFANIEIDITNVTELADAVYYVEAEIPSKVSSLYLQNTSDTWRIATEMGEEPFMMVQEGLSISIDIQADKTNILPVISTLLLEE